MNTVSPLLRAIMWFGQDTAVYVNHSPTACNAHEHWLTPANCPLR